MKNIINTVWSNNNRRISLSTCKFVAHRHEVLVMEQRPESDEERMQTNKDYCVMNDETKYSTINHNLPSFHFTLW